MSLATRCTACGTIFRVVPDQLRVSEGWVRCGRCAEVFDAREQLFDIDREAPPPWPAESAATEAMMPADEAPAAPLQDQQEPWNEPAPLAASAASRAEAIEQQPASDLHAEPQSIDEPSLAPEPLQAERAIDERREPVWADAGHTETDAPLPAREPARKARERAVEPTAPSAPSSDAQEPVAPALAAPSSEADSRPEPSFLRQAEASSRWHRPGMRAALSLLTLLLSVLLLAQLIWQFRDAMNAVFPQAGPGLRAMCQLAGCELKPWKRIDALTVENSNLSVAGNGNNYKLSISLHNKAAYPLALPWVDLSLTDANGGVVLRRMLKPGDFSNPAAETIQAHGEESLQIVFNTGAARVAGYSIEIFHP